MAYTTFLAFTALKCYNDSYLLSFGHKWKGENYEY